ncbi:MAG: hypothetical protein HRU11_09050 [Parvularculaceae bacterium]|nr:hypothetical protein [Parvularculaceae bacterium]
MSGTTDTGLRLDGSGIVDPAPAEDIQEPTTPSEDQSNGDAEETQASGDEADGDEQGSEESTHDADEGGDNPNDEKTDRDRLRASRKAQRRQKGLIRELRREHDQTIASKDREIARLERQLRDAEAEMTAHGREEVDDLDDAERAAHKAEGRTLQRQKRQAQDALDEGVQQRQETLQTVVEDVIRAGSEAYEDFEKQLSAFTATARRNITDERDAAQFAETVLTSDETGDLIYYLGTNPDELEKLAGLPATRRGVELGRLAAALEGARSKSKPKSENPPEPAPRLGGGRTASTAGLSLDAINKAISEGRTPYGE